MDLGNAVVTRLVKTVADGVCMQKDLLQGLPPTIYFGGGADDALSTYKDGVISGVNDTAKRIGVAVGMKARDAARIMLGYP